MSESKQEFYVGYLPAAPAGLARFLKLRILLLLFALITIAAVLTALQSPYSKAVFEYGEVRSFAGRIESEPYPTLVVPRLGGGNSRFLLTVFGKRGADAEVAGFDGKRVRLEGSLIYRDDLTMVEVAAGTVEELDSSEKAGATSPTVHTSAERRTLVGEIVDSKCYLGVMKPGNLKPHRACATRCISGGVPPVLLVRDATGNATYYLLTSASGGAVNRSIIERDLVAEPVRITGVVSRVGDRMVLRADPNSYERIP